MYICMYMCMIMYMYDQPNTGKHLLRFYSGFKLVRCRLK